jgi:hypothetical protein
MQWWDFVPIVDAAKNPDFDLGNNSQFLSCLLFSVSSVPLW